MIGATDCAQDASLDEMEHNLKKAILQAKALTAAGEVAVSSILPRLTDDHIQDRIDEMNSCIESLCTAQNVTFIENGPSFRLGNGEVNEGFLDEDGVHLNKAGTNKLIKNLHLEGHISYKAWNAMSTKQVIKSLKKEPAQKKPQTKPQQDTKVVTKRAPCYNCGVPNHTSNVCVYKTRITCHKCGRLGHKSTRCGKL